jgi:DNA processing protein
MQKDLAYWLAFNKIYGLGPVKLYSIWKNFNNLQDAWYAPLDELKNLGVLSEANLKLIQDARKEFVPEQELEFIEKNNIGVLTLIDNNYPQSLRMIHDPPFILYYKGEYNKDYFDKCVGVVGTRKPSYSGRKTATNISVSLAELGVTIVSGLAAGIDTEAHKGALKVDNGRTIAILGCGVDIIYPPHNEKLYGDIIERGMVISTYPPGTPPDARNFPPRNRIISGLSKGIIVIEAAERSGALITADFAIEQGREVFAVPGDIYNPMGKGPNNLLKQGATLVTEAADIIDALNWKIVGESENANLSDDNNPHVENLNLGEEEKEIYLVLNNEPQHLDNILNKVSLSLADITSNLVMLELKQLIKQLPGKLFVRI